MSTSLVKLAGDYLRPSLEAQKIAVETYGGELNAEEISRTSVKCPGVLVTCLGWVPPPAGANMAGKDATCAQMLAFVVTNQTQRTERMSAAMELARRVERLLKAWVPQDNEFFDVTGPELGSFRCENLYSSRMDKAGLALWMVSWRQCTADRALTPEQEARLVDWLGVAITSTATQPTPPTPAASTLVVTHGLDFKPTT